jgi:hypothetical protein
MAVAAAMAVLAESAGRAELVLPDWQETRARRMVGTVAWVVPAKVVVSAVQVVSAVSVVSAVWRSALEPPDPTEMAVLVVRVVSAAPVVWAVPEATQR